MFDLVIVGAGPAGLSAAKKAKEKGLCYACFEKELVANTFYDYPAGKHVHYYPANIELIDEFPLPEGTPCDIISEWSRLAKDLDVSEHEEVIDVNKLADTFEIKTNKGEYEARFVIIAIGVQGSPRKVPIDCDCPEKICYKIPQPKDYAGKKVIVVGGGDTAIEHAILLKEAGAEVVISYRKPEFFRLKEANQKAIDESGIEIIFNSNVLSFSGGVAVLDIDGVRREIEADNIAVFAGSVPATDFLSRAGLELEANKPKYDPETYESNVSGMFIAGDLTKQPLIKHAINHGVIIVDEIRKRI